MITCTLVGVEAPRKCRSEESSPSTATLICAPPKNSWDTQFLLEVNTSLFCAHFALSWVWMMKLQLYRDPGLTVLVSNNSEPQPRWALDRLAPGHHYTARFLYISQKGIKVTLGNERQTKELFRICHTEIANIIEPFLNIFKLNRYKLTIKYIFKMHATNNDQQLFQDVRNQIWTTFTCSCSWASHTRVTIAIPHPSKRW